MNFQKLSEKIETSKPKLNKKHIFHKFEPFPYYLREKREYETTIQFFIAVRTILLRSVL